MVGSGELFDGLGHLADVFGGEDDAFRFFEAERGGIGEEGLGVLSGVLLDGLIVLDGVADDLVLDVGDVHDVVEGESAGAQGAAEDVLEGERPEVADVDVAVDSGSAGVHTDCFSVERVELFQPLGERIVEPQRHGGLNL